MPPKRKASTVKEPSKKRARKRSTSPPDIVADAATTDPRPRYTPAAPEPFDPSSITYPPLTFAPDLLPEVHKSLYHYSPLKGFTITGHPRLPAAETLTTKLSKQVGIAQLRHYGLPCPRRSQVAAITKVLHEAVRDGECDEVPESMKAVQRLLEERWTGENQALLQALSRARLEKWGNATEQERVMMCPSYWVSEFWESGKSATVLQGIDETAMRGLVKAIEALGGWVGEDGCSVVVARSETEAVAAYNERTTTDSEPTDTCDFIAEESPEQRLSRLRSAHLRFLKSFTPPPLRSFAPVQLRTDTIAGTWNVDFPRAAETTVREGGTVVMGLRVYWDRHWGVWRGELECGGFEGVLVVERWWDEEWDEEEGEEEEGDEEGGYEGDGDGEKKVGEDEVPPRMRELVYWQEREMEAAGLDSEGRPLDLMNLDGAADSSPSFNPRELGYSSDSEMTDDAAPALDHSPILRHRMPSHDYDAMEIDSPEPAPPRSFRLKALGYSPASNDDFEAVDPALAAIPDDEFQLASTTLTAPFHSPQQQHLNPLFLGAEPSTSTSSHLSSPPPGSVTSESTYYAPAPRRAGPPVFPPRIPREEPVMPRPYQQLAFWWRGRYKATELIIAAPTPEGNTGVLSFHTNFSRFHGLISGAEVLDGADGRTGEGREDCLWNEEQACWLWAWQGVKICDEEAEVVKTRDGEVGEDAEDDGEGSDGSEAEGKRGRVLGFVSRPGGKRRARKRWRDYDPALVEAERRRVAFLEECERKYRRGRRE